MRKSTIKSIAALALTGAGSALVRGFKTTGDVALDTTGQTGSASGSTATAGQAGSDAAGSAGGGSSAGGSTSGGSTSGGSATADAYADGTYTGAEISEPWGPFQVQVVISGGAITEIKVVESPTDRHSSSINSRAVPALTQSVLASHGTSVDMVSGATWTSDSYASSLQSALDAAARAA
jgi:uncharacterized protein with FMN-binding domain